ncbi:MAG TPA: phosphoribosyltransferase [Rhodocyclaceae bacterium]
MNAGGRCEIVGWDRFYALARRLARRVRESGYRPDAIVAIGRGGYVPGRVLSDFLGQPRFAGLGVEHYRDTRKESHARIGYPLPLDVGGQRVLLVDDVDDSGDTFAAALAHLDAQHAPAQVRTAVLSHKRNCPFVPDYCARIVGEWRWVTYPWAVAEDVGALVRAMEPAAPDEVARRLSDEHGIRMRRDVLLDVLAAVRD